ncbi:thioredoxin [Namhaeicola litoreus]|uniref:Thioredoxin n=1 Tax=Namhaeicola litoreus TaxID=1052145 RepID=A0ABW3Y0C1_9FLAO
MSSFNDIISQKTPVLVDFKADWCGPCKMMAPILKEVKDHYKEKLKIVKIDIDQNPAVAQKFGIRGVPTMILFKDGQSAWRQSGVMQANELISVLNAYV